jgi:tRNA-specific 2-thiouridylase
MSGGIDSSVVAARLVAEGYDVLGVTLHLSDATPLAGVSHGAGPLRDAAAVCAGLGIPHTILDRRELFRRTVVEPFARTYAAGRTPSPCCHCNPLVKIAELLRLADELGIGQVATGHYARIKRDAAGLARLYRGADPSRDQGYFLHRLSPAALGRLLLPLGPAFKRDVRAEAQARGLPVAGKKESRELCFVPDGGYAALVASLAPDGLCRGEIVDRAGRRLGEHRGLHAYTVGQRKGLGVALGRPAYVVALEQARNRVVLGAESELYARRAHLDAGRFADDVVFPCRAEVQVRAQHLAVHATLRPRPDGSLDLLFDHAVRAMAPGQMAVAYVGERVLGGAEILSVGDEP